MAPIVNGNLVLRAASWLAAEVGDDDWSVGPRPPARATVHSSGPTPYRALLFGGGPAVGYGVQSHELALAGYLARHLSDDTGCGVDMDVVVEVDLRCRDMVGLMVDVDVDRYDMVFLSVGIQDVLDFVSPAVWADDLQRVLRLFRRAPHRPLPVFVIGAPPVTHILRVDPLLARTADRRAEQFNQRLRTLCDATPELTYVPFSPNDPSAAGRHRTAATYHGWAEQIADRVAPVVRSVSRTAQPSQNEEARQAALDRLGILDTAADEAFDRVAGIARRFCGTRGASISFIDHDRQWFKSTIGVSVSELPRAAALCDFTINTFDGFVVEDALADPALADSHFVSVGLRAYAGVPIRDPRGYLVGALCVFDPEPRVFTPDEMVYLRDLAHLVEEQLLLVA